MKHKTIWLIVALLIPINPFLGCGSSATPTPAAKVIQTEGLTPTPTPLASPTPTIAPTATPLPSPTPNVADAPHPELEAIIIARLQEILAKTPTPGVPAPTPMPEPTPTKTPLPTRTPTPTPEPIIRSVAPPASNVQATALNLSSIRMQGRTLSLSGTLEGQSYKPTTIQVWQAYDFEPYSETCSTERPIAFIQPGNGSVTYTGQLSPYSWSFCRNGYANRPQIDQVPWLYSQSWSYTLRKRIRISDPYIYDFSMTANLDHERVETLEYGSGVAAGWRVIVFSGSTIIAMQWLDY